MTIFAIKQEDVQVVSVIANPPRSFSSSSAGVTGSVVVFPRRSSIQKSFEQARTNTALDDSSVEGALRAAQIAGRAARLTSSSFVAHAEHYMDRASSAAPVPQASVEIERVVPSSTYGTWLSKKTFAKDLLAPWHKLSCPSHDWSYTNYHSLNFFTSSTVSERTAILYPNVETQRQGAGSGTASKAQRYVTGAYALSGPLTFDFSINPRFAPPEGVPFRAGTIFHLSSCYAVSLISGSARDGDGRVRGYRLQLQLSHSADVRPSDALPGEHPNDLTFVSDDNALTRGSWHRCVIRWGTADVNDGTGSFVIDGSVRGSFVIPSGTVTPLLFSDREGPAFLAVGNFVDSPNTSDAPHASIFGPSNSVGFGLARCSATDGSSSDLVFEHPLNAEVHDLTIWGKYVSDSELTSSGSTSPVLHSDVAAFYLAPTFRQSSSIRRSMGDGVGGVAITPWVSCDGTTEDPQAALVALSVSGHVINIENFLTDLANDVDPLVIGAYVTGALPLSSSPNACDAFFTFPEYCRRNTMLLPCDDGKWTPRFELIGECLSGSRHADSIGRPDPSRIALTGIASTGSLLFGSFTEAASGSQDALLTDALGITPESFAAQPGPALASRLDHIASSIDAGSFTPGEMRDVPTCVFHRTRDDSAVGFVMFDVSSIFYGSRIAPGTITITDQTVTGTGGAVSVTLRDDSMGGLYRADSCTTHAKWSHVGSVFYEEGLIVIKNPCLALFGKDGFTVSFRGERPTYVTRIDALAPANHLNSSSNPSYTALSPSGDPNDPDGEFVYVSGVNFHDDNMNVVARAALAQPIVKRTGDRIMFRVRIDW